MATYTFPLTLDKSVTVAGYPTWEEVPSDDISPSPTAKRVFVINWVDYPGFIVAIGGGWNATLGVYQPPLAHPKFPYLYVTAVKLLASIPGPNGSTIDSSGLTAYAWARAEVTYSRLLFDPSLSGYTLGDISLEFAQHSAITGGSTASTWNYASGGPVAAASSPLIRVGSATLVLTRYNCSAPATAIQFSLGGTVNIATFSGADAQTLYFDGTASSKKITTAGGNNWTNSFRLQWNSAGWNTIWNPNKSGGAGFEAVKSVTGANPPYTPADFSPFYGFM